MRKPMMKKCWLWSSLLVGLMAWTLTGCGAPVEVGGDSVELTGYVFYESSYDPITDRTEPVEGATVTVSDPAGLEEDQVATTDVGGVYSFKKVRGGVYNITISMEGFQDVVYEGTAIDTAIVVNVGGVYSLDDTALAEPELTATIHIQPADVTLVGFQQKEDGINLVEAQAWQMGPEISLETNYVADGWADVVAAGGTQWTRSMACVEIDGWGCYGLVDMGGSPIQATTVDGKNWKIVEIATFLFVNHPLNGLSELVPGDKIRISIFTSAITPIRQRRTEIDASLLVSFIKIGP